ncbi:MAG: DUF4142 domain-containing protein [Planctomycetota bacterium]
MFRKMFVASAFVMVTTSVALLSAQAPATKAPAKSTEAVEAKAPRNADSASEKRSPDHLLATCVALGNQGEIAISEIARTKTQNEDVKKFAAMMITDHHAFLEKLQKYAPEATKAGYLDGAPKEARKAGKAREEIKQTAATEDADKAGAVKTADAHTGDSADHHFHHMQLERELAAQCLASAKEKLEEKSGNDFDRCFIGHQIGMHMAMKDKLVVFQRHVSPELAELLAAGQKTTEEHLAEAETLMGKLEHHSTTRTVETKRDGKLKERKVTKETE